MRWIWIGLIIVLVGAVIYQVVWGGKRLNTGINLSMETNAPGFEGGGTWLNSGPLTMRGLMEEKKVVLVDFWTYSCINCQRTIPYLKQWWEKYKEKGLVIVGVHSPEFEFEKDTDNVKTALRRYGVTWPVVQDNEMKIWNAYANHYWPAKYLVAQGKIIYTHFGEGNYEETESKIREELKKLGYEVDSMPMGSDNGAASGGFDISPETYVGYDRGRYGNPDQIQEDKLKVYEIKGMVGRDAVYLGGEWTQHSEYGEAGKGAELVYRFKAGEVNLVMRGAGKVKVLIDGKETKTVEIEDSDLYNLYKGGVMEAEMKLIFDSGVMAYAFTFGQ